jgi:hypothetical protein
MLASFLAKHKYLWLAVLPLWTYGAFMLAQVLVLAVQHLLLAVGVPLQSIQLTA